MEVRLNTHIKIFDEKHIFWWRGKKIKHYFYSDETKSP